MDTMNEVVDLAQRLSFWKVDVPREAAQAILAWQAATTPSSGSPIDDVRLAATHGKLTPKNAVKAVDDAALALVVADKRQAVLLDLAPALAGRAAGSIRDHGDDIVEGLRPHWDKAVKQLTDAAAVIEVGATAEQVIGRGPDAVNAWNDLQVAESTLNTLAYCRERLRSPIGYGPGSTPAVAMFVDLPMATRQKLAEAEQILLRRDPRVQTERGGSWRLLLDAGCELHLNTAAEVRAVVDAARETVGAGRG